MSAVTVTLSASDQIFFREDDGEDNSFIADREVDHLTNGIHNGEKTIDSQSLISDSTCTIDIDRDNEDKAKLDEGNIRRVSF